jgi:hypothetical protein
LVIFCDDPNRGIWSAPSIFCGAESGRDLCLCRASANAETISSPASGDAATKTTTRGSTSAAATKAMASDAAKKKKKKKKKRRRTTAAEEISPTAEEQFS